MFGAGLDERTLEDFGESLVPGRNLPAALGLPMLELDDFIEDILPGPRRGFRIGGHHVGASHLEIHERHRVSLVAPVQQADGVGLVFCAQGLLATALSVLAPKGFPASEESEFLLHNRFGYKAWGHCPHLH